MKTTTEWLRDSAPQCAQNWWERNKSRFETDLDVVNALLADDHLEWANWLIVRLLDGDKRTEYAIFAAEQVLPIYEAYAPRKAIEAIKAGKPTEDIDLIESAIKAVIYAIRATRYPGVHFAYRAIDAALSAADAATLKAIVNHGITLLTEVNE